MPNSPRNTRPIEERLASERPARHAPDGFTDRVIANLPSNRPSAPRSVPRLWPRFAVGFAGLALVALVSFQFRQPTQPQPAPPELAASPAAATPEVIEIELPRIPSGHLEALTVQLDQPLEKELKNVISDTRQAIQFVASSFLPEK